MDALFHFVFQLVGGYVLLTGLKIRFNILILILLAFCSLLVDVEHIFTYLGIFGWLKLHTIFVVIIPSLILLLLYFIKKGSYELYAYLLTFSVMLFGEILADMITGMYGIPLLYPFSDTLYMIPKSWEICFFDNCSMKFVSTHGIAMLIYFGVISLIILIKHFVRRD